MGQMGRVTFEEYISDAHKDFIDGGGSTAWVAGNDVYTALNTMLNGVNPYVGAEFRDPSSDITDLQMRMSAFTLFTDIVNESDSWSNWLSVANGQLDTLVPMSQIISDHVVEWESHFDSAHTKIDTVLPVTDLIESETTSWEGFVTSVLAQIADITPLLSSADTQTDIWDGIVTAILNKIETISPLLAGTDTHIELWEAMLASVLAKLPLMLPTTVELENAVAAYERQARANLARSYQRLQAGMFDINATDGSAYPMAIAMLENQYSADLTSFSAGLYLQNLRDRSTILAGSIGQIGQTFVAKLQGEHERLVTIMQSITEMSKLFGDRLQGESARVGAILQSIDELSRMLVSKAQLNLNKAQLIIGGSDGPGRILAMREQEALETARMKSVALMQSMTTMAQLFTQKGAWLAGGVQLQLQTAAAVNAAWNDKIEADVKYNVEEAKWPLEVLNKAWSVLAAPTGIPGAQLVPSKFERAMSMVFGLASMVIPIIGLVT